MTNDLTPAQNAGTTGNPQSINGSPTTSDSSPFQQSAGADALDQQNHSLTVEHTGRAVTGNGVVSTGSTVLMWVFVVVASIVLLMIASSVFKWVMKRPDPVETKKEKAPEKSASTTEARAKGKKKQPRSKRKK